MTPNWQVVFVFTGRSIGDSVPTFVVGLSLFVFGIAGLMRSRRSGRPFDQHGHLEWPFALIAAGVFFGGSEGLYFLFDRDLASAISHDACQTISGKITHIEPDHGGGDREFTIGSREIRYDNHSVGFDGQLCDDVDVCEGDFARLCLKGVEIGRIEKWVGSAQRDPQ